MRRGEFSQPFDLLVNIRVLGAKRLACGARRQGKPFHCSDELLLIKLAVAISVVLGDEVADLVSETR